MNPNLASAANRPHPTQPHQGPNPVAAAAFVTTPRQDMVLAGDIERRMGRDMVDTLKMGGMDHAVTREDLLSLGWTENQIDTHASKATAYTTSMLPPADLGDNNTDTGFNDGDVFAAPETAARVPNPAAVGAGQDGGFDLLPGSAVERLTLAIEHLTTEITAWKIASDRWTREIERRNALDMARAA